MKRTIFVAMFCLVASCCFAKMSGAKIAELVKYKNQSRTSIAKATLFLYGNRFSSNASESRRVVLQTKMWGRGNRKNVIRFTSSGYRGTTFLSIEKPNSETFFYIYLNNVGRARRLASSEKQNNFIDTDFSNETLGGLKLSEYRYKRISDMKRDGKLYYRVWGFKKERNAKYPKYLAIVDAKRFVAVEVRVFNRSGKLAKIVKLSDVRRVAGKYWVPFRMEIQDLIANHKSVIKINSMRVDCYVRSSIFKPWNLKRSW